MYPLIAVPIFANKSFFDFTKNEAKKYFQWFLAIKTERVKILENQVQQIYPGWELNYSRTSLIELYEWFRQRVTYRQMNEDERETVRKQLSNTPLLANEVAIPETTFTEQTVSVCFDIGVYIGESLIFNLPELRWIQKLNSTNFIDYAQPLIAKKESKVPLNPRRAIEGIGSRILDRDAREITIIELFDMSYERFS